jgi:hypothetical protein
VAAEVVALLRKLYPEGPLPKPFPLLEAAATGRLDGLSPAARKKVAALAASSDPVRAALGIGPAFVPPEDLSRKTRTQLGRMLVGHLAERAFEEIYKRTIGTDDLHLEKITEKHNETDYRVINGSGRQVFRINIKFHGTLFRDAKKVVGLEPEDCFALATYKIKQGLEKHDKEGLPYLFLIVSANIAASDVGDTIPQEIANLWTLIASTKGKVEGKKRLEDRLVDYLVREPPLEFATIRGRLIETLAHAKWRVLSARKAQKVMKDLLFQRVFALTVKNFTRAYSRAEVDMHFSLSTDMMALEDFLKQLKTMGHIGMGGLIADGKI